jgi:hypothetical protein
MHNRLSRALPPTFLRDQADAVPADSRPYPRYHGGDAQMSWQILSEGKTDVPPIAQK